MPVLEEVLDVFVDSLISHAALVVYLLVIMDERGWGRLSRLPVLLFSPLVASWISIVSYKAFSGAPILCYCLDSSVILLMCTLWVKWAWCIGFWRAFAATCMAGGFQVSVSCLSRTLFMTVLLDRASQFMVVMVIYWAAVLGSAALLYRLRFGGWFRLLLEDGFSQRRTALFFFAMEATMEVFIILQKGIQPAYLIPYCLLMMIVVALIAGLVIYLAQRSDAARKIEAQQDVIAQQQLYEQDLEAIRQEVQAFRHDYKNLLAGLSQAADEGELGQLRASLSALDAGFDRRIGQKIQVSAQTGNLLIPQVRSLLLFKLAAMGKKGIDCRLEVLYPVESVCMDVWDLVRCLGILLDNAAEGALETQTPWVEIVLLAQGERLSLRVSNPYEGIIDPDKIWETGFSTKGEGRGLGLSSYQHILTRYSNTVSSTGWAGGVFVQELAIGERP